MVCGIYPAGVEGKSCSDSKMVIGDIDEQLAWYGDAWQPDGASYYGDELVLEPVQRLTLEQRLRLLDTHPLFTGRCPRCERAIAQAQPGQVHWDCENCGWVDDSV